MVGIVVDLKWGWRVNDVCSMLGSVWCLVSVFRFVVLWGEICYKLVWFNLLEKLNAEIVEILLYAFGLVGPVK